MCHLCIFTVCVIYYSQHCVFILRDQRHLTAQYSCSSIHPTTSSSHIPLTVLLLSSPLCLFSSFSLTFSPPLLLLLPVVFAFLYLAPPPFLKSLSRFLFIYLLLFRKLLILYSVSLAFRYFSPSNSSIPWAILTLEHLYATQDHGNLQWACFFVLTLKCATHTSPHKAHLNLHSSVSVSLITSCRPYTLPFFFYLPTSLPLFPSYRKHRSSCHALVGN